MECSVSMLSAYYCEVNGRLLYMRGTQLASRTTQIPLNTSLSFSPSSCALSFSLSITIIVVCANEDMKHRLSSLRLAC